MKTVDVDLNFIFLIMMLAIVLLASITGYNMGKMTATQGIVIWQIVFLVLCMALLALALLFPYLIYWVGHLAILLGSVKTASFIYLYFVHPNIILSIAVGMLVAEIISTLLILASGVILVKNNPKL